MNKEQIEKIEEIMAYNMPVRIAYKKISKKATDQSNGHMFNLLKGQEYTQSLEDYASIVSLYLCETVDYWRMECDNNGDNPKIIFQSDEIRKGMYKALEDAIGHAKSASTTGTLYAIDYDEHGNEINVWVEQKDMSRKNYRKYHTSYLMKRAKSEYLFSAWQEFAEFIAVQDLRPITKSHMQMILWYKLQGMQENEISGNMGISKRRIEMIVSQMRALYNEWAYNNNAYVFKKFIPMATPVHCEWVRHEDVPKARQAQKGARVDRRDELRQHEKAMVRHYKLKKPVQAQEWHTLKTGAPMAQDMRHGIDIDTWIYRNSLRDIDFKCAREEEDAIRKALAQ